jgi:hypothetical protein
MAERIDPVEELNRIVSFEILIGSNHRGERALPGRAIMRQSAAVREALSTLKSRDVENLRRDDLALFSHVYLKDTRELQDMIRRQSRALARIRH